MLLSNFILFLNLFLLSNSTALRQDQSTLYSKFTITILPDLNVESILMITFIVWDNLYFLYLNIGIELLDLFHSTVNTSVLFIIISFLKKIPPLLVEYSRKIFLKKNNYIRSTKMYITPHSFSDNLLKSTLGGDSSRLEILAKLKEKKSELNESKEALNTVYKAIKLDNQLPDKSLNASMRDIKQYYSHFFDEESGNTHKEGLQQLIEELKSDYSMKRQEYADFKKNLEKTQNFDPDTAPKPSISGPKPSISELIPISCVRIILLDFDILVSLFRCVLPLIGILISLDIIYVELPDFMRLYPEFTEFIRFTLFYLSWVNFIRKLKKSITLSKIVLTYIKTNLYKFVFILLFIVLLFIFIPQEWLSVANLLAFILKLID